MHPKAAVSIAAMFLMSVALAFAGHALFARNDPGALDALRPGANPYTVLAHLCIAVGFVWMYLRSRADGPFLAQGIRFGAGMLLLMSIPVYIIYSDVQPQPLPGLQLAQQILVDGVGVISMGIVVAWLNA
jgi:hypothetical protein